MTMKNKILAATAHSVPYIKELRPVAKSIAGCILMQQLDYWFYRHPEGFYKFLEPCTNELYREGDSWCEELNITPDEFRSAFDRIGVRYTSKLGYTTAADKFQERYYCSYYDKKRGVTHYFRNHELLDEALDSALSKMTPGSSYPPRWTPPSLEMEKPSSHLGKSIPTTPKTQSPLYNRDYAETTSEISSDNLAEAVAIAPFQPEAGENGSDQREGFGVRTKEPGGDSQSDVVVITLLQDTSGNNLASFHDREEVDLDFGVALPALAVSANSRGGHSEGGAGEKSGSREKDSGAEDSPSQDPAPDPHPLPAPEPSRIPVTAPPPPVIETIVKLPEIKLPEKVGQIDPKVTGQNDTGQSEGRQNEGSAEIESIPIENAPSRFSQTTPFPGALHVKEKGKGANGVSAKQQCSTNGHGDVCSLSHTPQAAGDLFGELHADTRIPLEAPSLSAPQDCPVYYDAVKKKGSPEYVADRARMAEIFRRVYRLPAGLKEPYTDPQKQNTAVKNILTVWRDEQTGEALFTFQELEDCLIEQKRLHQNKNLVSPAAWSNVYQNFYPWRTQVNEQRLAAEGAENVYDINRRKDERASTLRKPWTEEWNNHSLRGQSDYLEQLRAQIVVAEEREAAEANASSQVRFSGGSAFDEEGERLRSSSS